MIEERKFWSIEYTDEDGDLITTNTLATKVEMDRLMSEFMRRGIKVTIYDLSPPTVNSRNVLS